MSDAVQPGGVTSGGGSEEGPTTSGGGSEEGPVGGGEMKHFVRPHERPDLRRAALVDEDDMGPG
jgi:hypothetical protein